jgi:6-phosphogluconate dehydrogenase (decarboxylating)
MLGAKTFDIFLAREVRMEEALQRYLESMRRNSVRHECKNAQRAEEAYAKVKGTGSIDEDHLKMAAEIAVEIAVVASYKAESLEVLNSKIYENDLKHIEKIYKQDLAMVKREKK